jgi:hypothetical protein
MAMGLIESARRSRAFGALLFVAALAAALAVTVARS